MAAELPALIAVTVTNGAGSVNTYTNGPMMAYGCIPPVTGAVYDLEFLDADGFGIAGEPALTGNSTVNEAGQLYGRITVRLSNCSSDGVYKVKIWFSPSGF